MSKKVPKVLAPSTHALCNFLECVGQTDDYMAYC